MATGEEPPLRRQLIEARERITAQLDAIDFRARGAGGSGRSIKLPDYTAVAAELQDELREINAILNTEDSPDP